MKIIEKIKTGGSERKFFRCQREDRNYILMKDHNLTEYLRLHTHLQKRGIGVPEIFKINIKHRYLIMEDLGNNSLYRLVKCNKRKIIKLYQLAIDELIKLQIDAYPSAPINLYYDYEHIKWEQEYFKKHFLHQYCNLPCEQLKELANDFKNLSDDLIKEMANLTNFLMHRDYQSKNIYIKNGRPIIIDFQSARIGPLSYDLTSLLKDAYVEIPKKTATELLNYYLTGLKLKGIPINSKNFLKLYQLTGLQRNMQALGAFANLSLNKNKWDFEKYIPRGLELLNETLKKSKYMRLAKLVSNLMKFEKVALP